MTLLDQLLQEFDERFRFAGTYAMGELQANNIKSFLKSAYARIREETIKEWEEKVIGEDECGVKDNLGRRAIRNNLRSEQRSMSENVKGGK